MYAKRTYRPPLQFDIEEQGSRVSFVHLDISATRGKLYLLRNDKNKSFLCGWESQPTKIRYPPFLGFSLVRVPKMRSWIRASWFAELNTQDLHLRSLGAVRAVAGLVMLGYPLPLLKRAVGGITQQPVRGLRGTALRHIRALRKKYRDQ